MKIPILLLAFRCCRADGFFSSTEFKKISIVKMMSKNIPSVFISGSYEPFYR
jgi:hypothetical protein